jgi:hypothetical protein
MVTERIDQLLQAFSQSLQEGTKLLSSLDPALKSVRGGLSQRIANLEAVVKSYRQWKYNLLFDVNVLEIQAEETIGRDRVERVKKIALKIVEEVKGRIGEEYKGLVVESLMDLMDESICKVVAMIGDGITEKDLIDGVWKFIGTRQEAGVRESIESVSHIGIMGWSERWTRAAGRIGPLFCIRAESIANNAEKRLQLSKSTSISPNLYGHSSNLPLIENHKFQAASQREPSNQAVWTHAASLNVAQSPSASPHPSVIGEPAIINIDLYKSSLPAGFSSFPRLAMAILFSSLTRTKEALASPHQIHTLHNSIIPFLTLLSQPSVKVHLIMSPYKQSILSLLSNLLYVFVCKIQSNVSSDNEIGLYHAVSAYFDMDKALGLNIDDQDRGFYMLPQFTLVVSSVVHGFIRALTKKSEYFFETYLSSNLDKFKELDLFNLDFNAALCHLPSDHPQLVENFQEMMAKKNFFDSPTATQHYMVPFVFILQRLDDSGDGAMIWATKAVIHQLVESLCKRKKYISVKGYLSLLLNLEAYIMQLDKKSHALCREICSLGEVRYIRGWGARGWGEEKGKRIGSIAAVSKRGREVWQWTHSNGLTQAFIGSGALDVQSLDKLTIFQ